MKINKNSWHYKVWKLTYAGHSLPRVTNLCSYVQRIIWLGLVAQLLFIPLRILALTLATIIGVRPAKDKIKDVLIGNTRRNIMDLDSSPITFSSNPDGPPIIFICWGIVLGLVALGLFYRGTLNALHYQWSTYLFFSGLGLLFLAGLSKIIGSKVSKNSTVQLFLAYLKAKKDKVCPTVVFDEGREFVSIDD
jgi:hypothetical protein